MYIFNESQLLFFGVLNERKLVDKNIKHISWYHYKAPAAYFYA